MRNLKNIILSFSALAIASTLSTVAIAKEWRGWNIHKPGYPNTVAMDKSVSYTHLTLPTNRCV